MHAANLTTEQLNERAGRWLPAGLLRWSMRGAPKFRHGGSFTPATDLVDAVRLLEPLNAAGWYAMLLQVDDRRWLAKLKRDPAAAGTEDSFRAVESTLPLALTRAAVWALPYTAAPAAAHAQPQAEPKPNMSR